MREIERFLAPDEEIEFLSRKHPSGLYRRGLLFAIAIFLGSAAGFYFNPSRGDDVVDWVAGGLVVLAGLRFLFALLRWRSEQIALTRRRLVVTSGLLKREVTTVPLKRIRNVTLSRTLGARLQRYGDVILDVGEHGIIEVRRIPRVRYFYTLLAEEMSGRAAAGPLPTERLEDDDTGPLPRVVL